MTDGIAAVVLAAGAGTRLRPLSLVRPKALCPVGNVALVDLAIERVRSVTDDVAVNVHHGRAAMVDHLGRSVHVSIEEHRALGTAGALGQLRGWLDGRSAVVVNADAWCPGSLEHLVAGWDGSSVRVLVAGGGALTPTSAIAGALMPWSTIMRLAAEPTGLYEVVWAPALEAGRLEVVRHVGPFVDCGSPAQYLAANLAASGGVSVVGEDAVVEGSIERCVVWPGAEVRATESIQDAIRARSRTGIITVLVR